MSRQDEWLLVLLREGADGSGVFRGRTRLHKVAALIQSLGVEVPFDIRYHHYGPYSDALAESLDTAILRGHVLHRETRVGDKHVRYDLQLSGSGAAAAESALETLNAPELERIEAVVEVSQSLNASEIELLGTYGFLHALAEARGEPSARQRLEDLKPGRSGEEYDAAKRNFERLVAEFE